MQSVELRDLATIQQRLSALITAPDSVEAALAAADDAVEAENARLGALPRLGSLASLDSLVRGDPRAPAVVRLGVYANAWFARLHDCLRDDFGALADALGPAAFHDLVKTYLMLHPPDRPSLHHAGRHLAAHLAREPFATIFGARWPWAADLARLEWALCEAWFAADARPLAAAELATLAPDRFESLRFGVSPSLALLRLAWPVACLRERFDRADAQTDRSDIAPALEQSAQAVRVWRQGESVRFREISDVEAAALERVIAGESFGAVCETVACFVGDGEAPARAAALLAGWIRHELLVGVETNTDDAGGPRAVA